MNAPVKRLLVPPGVVTLTFLTVRVVVAVIAQLALTVVAVGVPVTVQVMPPPDTFTALVPVKLVPVRVTGMLVPRAPVAGVIEVNVGIKL